MVALGPSRLLTMLAAALLVSLAVPQKAEAGGQPTGRVPHSVASLAGPSACGASCGSLVNPSPVQEPLDCHWEHVRVPADRFTVLVRRVRVCY